MFKNIYQSIKSNLKDSLVLIIIIFILLNFLFMVINTSGLNNYIINHIKNSIEIREVFNIENNIMFENDDKYYAYCEEIIKNLNEANDNGLDVDFSLSTSEIYHNEKLNIGFSPVSILNEDSLEYYNFNLIDGEFIKDSLNAGNINILMNERIADNFNYHVGDELELFINEQSYTFDIVGIYENKTGSLIYNPSIDEYAEIIMSTSDMLNIAKDTKSTVYYENVAFRYYGIENVEKYNNHIINIFKIPMTKYYSDIPFEYEITSNIDSINQLVLPLNNAAIVFEFMSILLLCIAFIILFSTISYIVKNRLKDLSIYIALGQNKLKTIMMMVLEISIIAFVSIILTIPTSIISNNKIKDIFIDVNTKRQVDIALINSDIKEYEEFVNEVDIYQDLNNYNISIIGFISIISLVYVIVIFSCIIGLKEIIYLKPKELIYKRG